MKKLLLSLCVVTVFIVYSFVFRHQGSKLVLKPVASTKDLTTSSAQTPTSTDSNATNTDSGKDSASSQTGITRDTNYHDGTYIGNIADAFYGNVQVKATISGGSITSVKFLQFPNDSPNSININSQAVPLLEQEALHAQSANVNIISGASDTSQGFIQSLSNALSQAD